MSGLSPFGPASIALVLRLQDQARPEEHSALAASVGIAPEAMLRCYALDPNSFVM
jgi:hypothetical protein